MGIRGCLEHTEDFRPPLLLLDAMPGEAARPHGATLHPLPAPGSGTGAGTEPVGVPGPSPPGEMPLSWAGGAASRARLPATRTAAAPAAAAALRAPSASPPCSASRGLLPVRRAR